MGDKFNRYVQAFLATTITIGFFGVIVGLFLVKEIPGSVKDILLVLLGALLASWKEVTGYFFGSSSGSAKKDDRNDALTAQLQASTPGAGVTITNDPSNPVNVTEVKT